MIENIQELLIQYESLLIGLYLFSVIGFYWCILTAGKEDAEFIEEFFTDDEIEEYEELSNSKLGTLFGLLGLFAGLFPIINIIVLIIWFTEELQRFLMLTFTLPSRVLERIFSK